MGSYSLRGTEAQLGKMRKVLEMAVGDGCQNSVDIFNASGLNYG